MAPEVVDLTLDGDDIGHSTILAEDDAVSKSGPRQVWGSLENHTTSPHHKHLRLLESFKGSSVASRVPDSRDKRYDSSLDGCNGDSSPSRSFKPHPEPLSTQRSLMPQLRQSCSAIDAAEPIGAACPSGGGQITFDPGMPASTTCDTAPSSFPAGFDRGRFPKERRNRGGKKNGLSRMGGSFAAYEGAFDSTPTTSPMTAKPSLANFEDDNTLWSTTELDQVVRFCLQTIAPTLEKQSRLSKSTLSDRQCEYLERRIANSAINDDLLRFLRSQEFSVSELQRKRIRKFLRGLYNTKAKLITSRGYTFGDPSSFRRKDIPWDDFQTVASSRNDQCSGSQYGQVSPTRIRLTSKDKHAKLHNDHTYRQTRQQSPGPIKTASVSTTAQTKAQKTTFVASSKFQPQEWTLGAPSRPKRSLPRLTYIENMDFDDIEGKQSEVATPLTDSMRKPTIQPTKVGSRHLTQRQVRTDAELEVEIARSMQQTSVPQRSVQDQEVEVTATDRERLLQQRCLFKGISRHELTAQKTLTMITSSVIDPTSQPARKLSTFLRHRELGTVEMDAYRQKMHMEFLRELQPWRKWKGASSDIVCVAWKPSSTGFVVGAAAHTNHEDIQYNRPCNLMLGDLECNMIWELPDHRTPRPKPSTIREGPNSLSGTYDACDPMVYQTVNAVAFSRDGKHMYSASRDKTMKIWDCQNATPYCTYTLDLEAVVACLDVYDGEGTEIFATARHTKEASVQLFQISDGQVANTVSLASSRAKERPTFDIRPECIRFAPGSHHNFLIAGFTQWAPIGRPGELAREGHLCLWDIRTGQRTEEFALQPNAQSVNSVAWHPYLPIFVAGGATGMKRRHTHYQSVVRTYDLRQSNRSIAAFDTEAFDIQDVTYHPRDSNIVTAGCANGKTFVWDFRQQDKPLHTLSHGEPLLELDAGYREESDTGVRLSAWGPEGCLYYSGSSDGMVKSWDIRRHPADVLVQDVAHMGAAIQDGAFSPDFSHLLIGDADGGIQILSCAPSARTTLEYDIDNRDVIEEMAFTRAPDGSGKRLNTDDDNPGTEGIEAAQALVQSGQIDVHPTFGPVQGKNYVGLAKQDEPSHEMDWAGGQNQGAHCGPSMTAVEAYRTAHAAMRRSLLDRPPRLSRLTTDDQDDRSSPQRLKAAGPPCSNGEDLEGVQDSEISEVDMLEEDFWFPYLGAQEIGAATGPR